MHGNQHQVDINNVDPRLDHMAQLNQTQGVLVTAPGASMIPDPNEDVSGDSMQRKASCTSVLVSGIASNADGTVAQPQPCPFLSSSELAAVVRVVGPSSFGTVPRLLSEADIERVVQVTNLAYQDATYFKAREWWDRVNAAEVRSRSNPTNPESAWIVIDGPPHSPLANQMVAGFNLHADAFLPGRVTVSMVAVDPAMHRQGLAKYCFALVWEAVRLIHARDLRQSGAEARWTPAKVLVEVVNLQKHLLDIYTKMGFVVVGERTWDEYGVPARYLTIPCHLVLMEKELVDPPLAAVDVRDQS